MKFIHFGKLLLAAGLTASMFSMSACGNRAAPGQGAAAQRTQSASIVVDNTAVASGVRALVSKTGTAWLPLDAVSESLGYHAVEDQGRYLIGGTDAAYSVRMNDTQASHGDTPIQLPHPPGLIEGKLYLSAASYSTLLGLPIAWDGVRSQLVITPEVPPSASSAGVGDKLDPQGNPAGAVDGEGTVQSLGVGNGRVQDLISFAKKFQGTPYQFNAPPYDQRHTFDCSSFMRHIYQHIGVGLPRSSIAQSRTGKVVAGGNMQPGDLMFFYTPGRYRSNRIVGHVGMYIGNNQFIQTWGAPGVVVSNYNSYWRNRFLFAKRVL